ncbi:molecule interacting with CasL [Haematobia irritans]|uniref:molecule interacting with CasL n=1 Tax=Haematobia irritans TaxID=7368 RepID=UPI003F4FADF7
MDLNENYNENSGKKEHSGRLDGGFDLCGPGPPAYYNCTVTCMSRSAHQRQQQKLQLQQQQLLAQQMADNEAAAAAAEMFDLFCVATTMRQILGLHRQMCDVIGLRPAPLNEFYPKLKTKVRSWKAQALWKKFDARASHRAYAKGNACTGTRVLVIGAGPCGLRTAIEAQLLGAKVVVVEKRDRISRNNVLHLWPFVITDLRNLGAKKFYGKFCAGSIDHISIRQLQCILLKVALLLGVEIHEGVSFERSIEPSGDGCGWRAQVTPADHAVSHYEFDVLIGADGKRNTLEGFKRKEFRGKLAIAITANFINKKTEAEAKAEEISGVAFIFNQSFFKELYHTTGIDLENIVYYKDETHYFVMTAKKHSLIDKGVIMQDFADPAELLAPVNVNTEKLLDYAREAAEFSTKYQMPNLEFAVNHYGKPDVAMFDFTSMFAAESSCRVIVRHGFRLLQCLVGDSLLEPFWPTGSGCARGFLSSMDAAYAIKLWANPANSTLGVMAQRESIYRLLGQTTPENLQRDTGGYTVDPATRYPNLNRSSVNVWQVKHLIDTDDKSILEQTFMDTNALQVTQVDTPVRRKRRSGDTMPLSAVLLRWICAQLHSYEFTKDLKEVSDVFTNGKVLCALINRYRPDLVDFNAIKDLSPIEMNDLAFKILDKELHIPRIMSGKDSVQLNTIESKIWLNYLEQICEVFRGEIPHVKHPKIDFSDLREKYRVNYSHAQPDFSKLLQLSSKQKVKSPIQDAVDIPQNVQRRSVLDEEKLKRQRRHEQLLGAGGGGGNNAAGAGNAAQTDTPRRAKKRRSAEKAANIEERQKRLEEIEQNRQDRQSKRRQQRYQQTQNFYKSLHMLQANILLREADENTPFEDYSIFLYRQQAPEFNDRVKELERKLLFPDRERGDIPSSAPRSNADEQFSDRIRSMEQRISSRNNLNDKKPKDLMRAIGKIDSNDWNVREIEKKIEQSKKTEVHGPKGREKVPKWSREQFQARQHKMAKPTRQDSAEEKFKEIDQTLKNLDKQLKEGSVLEVGERGRNKVASIAGQFVKRDDTPEEKTSPAPTTTQSSKSSTKVALAFKKQAASEKCHFCRQTVYLMEKLQTENLVMHRGCLKCHHCHTNLRLGAYAFDRDDPNGRFYCTQHFRLPAKPTRPIVRKPGQRKAPAHTNESGAAVPAGTLPSDKTPENAVAINSGAESGPDEPKTPEKRGPVDNVSKMDLLERGQTPERIEFENTDAMSDGEPSEEHIIDEHEWSGRNFLPESNNDSESDLSSSDESDTESNSDMYEEANDSPLGVQTLQLASEWIGKQNYSDSDISDDNYDSSEGLADDGKDDTEGEEFAKARELRREEVRLPPLPPNLPTDTETETPLGEAKESPTSSKELEKTNNNEPITANSNETKREVLDNKTNEANLLELKPPPPSFTERQDSVNSDQSFKSTTSSLPNGLEDHNLSLSPPSKAITVTPSTMNFTKADIEKLEQKSDTKLSAEIDAISAKLYNMNNVVKMNKDLETIAKENLIQSDILKKLSMKEKWLAENKQTGSTATNPAVALAKFDEKIDKLLPKAKFNDPGANANPYAPKSQFKDILKKTETASVESDKQTQQQQPPQQQKPKDSREVLAQIKELINKENEQLKAANRKPPSRNNSFNRSPLLKPKSAAEVNRLADTSAQRNNDGKMELENILGIVKKIEISKSESALKKPAKDQEAKDASQDIGKMLYRVETKFSPKPNRRMNDKLKEIEAKNFSGTLDSIKSQMEVPTISAQAVPANVDLSKYFPHQQQRKDSISTVNKNQKSLNEVDLTKYFPTSPAPQRKSSVVTVADRLRKSQTEKSLDMKTKNAENLNNKPNAPKRQTSLGGGGPVSSNFSLKDNQMDGALDIDKVKANVKVITTNAIAKLDEGVNKVNATKVNTNKNVTPNILAPKTTTKPSNKPAVTTTSAVATTTKNGKKVKIIKKIVRKGSLKKTNNNKNNNNEKSSSIIPRDEDDLILDEILQNVSDEMRSPSLEYQQLFQEERSPSDDLSDKIESILEETGIDLGLGKKSSSSPLTQQKKLLKAKSFGEGELQSRKNSLANERNKEAGDLPSGVQNILKRFESMSSVPSAASSMSSIEPTFKLRRMESTTSNLNKSKESIISKESESSFSDLEKTMEYLKSEWRSEATNFLQKKRNDFMKSKQVIPSTDIHEEQTMAERNQFAEYKDSKYAKFFGFKRKSPEKTTKPLVAKTAKQTELKPKAPEKRKSPLKKKQKTPEKKTKQPSPPKVSALPKVTKPLVYSSLEELALVSVSEQIPKANGNNEQQKEEGANIKTNISEDKKIPNLNSNTKEDCGEEKSKDMRDPEVPHTNLEKKSSLEIPTEAKDIPLSSTQGQPESGLPSTPENLTKRPLVEDIRNLPKTGCDKSLSNSRRGSLASIQSRRQSNASLGEITIDNLDSLLTSEDLLDGPFNKPILGNDINDEDSLCTSISKSPSAQPITVQMRGSSEDDSIDNLFSQFSDEMLVNVEFDSNDELIEITPVGHTSAAQKTLEDHRQQSASSTKSPMTSPSPPIRLQVPLKSPTRNEKQFPIRPKRRPKSKSSSSDSTAPLPPQRLKKKLSKLSPSSMPPSVQDLLHEVCRKELAPPQAEANNAPNLRFPRIIDEDDVLIEDTPIASKLFTQDKPHKNIVEVKQVSSAGEDVKISGNIVNDGFGYGPNKNPENVNEFTKVLKPLDNETNVDEPLAKDVTDSDSQGGYQGLKAKTPSMEWNMEMLPNSPMPKHKNVQKLLNKPPSLESLDEVKKDEWNMEMLPRSPMPQRKFRQATKSPEQEEKNKIPTNGKLANDGNLEDVVSAVSHLRDSNSILHEKSPTLSIKLLNTIDVKTEDSEKRLIEEFESERRQALVQRDKEYNINEKPLDLMKPPRKGSGASSNSSKLATPCNSITPPSKQGSRRSSQQSVNISNRGGTPPMMKPLELPSSMAASTTQSSRRSSFAFIELLDNKEPIIAPMPKKLELPKIEDEIIQPVNIGADMVPEEMKNRPWPKPQMDEEDEDKEVENNKEEESEPIEYANVINVSLGPKRQWPDGRTIFDKNKKDKSKAKPRSETPEMGHYGSDTTSWGDRGKPSSKSTNDLSKLSLPYASNYSLATTTRGDTSQITKSSNDSDMESSRNKSTTPLRTSGRQHQANSYSSAPTNTTSMDASTQMLLERSKQLHDRKRDFVNERVVERNPYMKEVIAAERRNSLGGVVNTAPSSYSMYDSDDDDDGMASSYRPRYYSSNKATSNSRFPSSRALGRSHINHHHYDYVPTYAGDGGGGMTSSSLYGGSSRRLPLVTPLSSLNHPYSSTSSYKPYTSTSNLSYGTGRNSYRNDISSRRSPSSQYHERSGGDKCVLYNTGNTLQSQTPSICYPITTTFSYPSVQPKCSWCESVQSDSESSTSDELEHNSATEISTDSEFDNDELIRSAPKIFIDDTHLRKPTKVQVKSTIIPPSMNYNGSNIQQKASTGTYLAKYQTQQQQQPLMPQFKPLIQVDPSLLTSNRTPLQNPRQGDYLLNKTASTEGIASKKSLELKKRYLLGEPANGNKIQKSGSTSVLDSRIRSFQSNISECQKLLNPSNDISPSMKTFLDRTTKLGDKTSQELMRSATNNILNDLKVEITIQKASSTASTDNEKENVFVNSKNELNKCMEYSESVNVSLLDSMSPNNKKSPSTTPTNNKNIIETVDLVTPEKEIDRDKSDSNKVIDLTGDSPEQKSNRMLESLVVKPPDVSTDVKQVIPDILGHIEEHGKDKDSSSSNREKSPQQEESNMEKVDEPEKQQQGDIHDDTEVEDVQIEVPNIAWNAHKSDNLSTSSSNSTCSSHSSSLEDIEHFILESTTSPETHNSAIAMTSSASGGNHQVPRVEVHDSSGTLMQIDSLMIIDGKYIGDPEDLKYMEVPEGIIVPEHAELKTTVLDDEHDVEQEHEPVTATPEPVETTVIEVEGKDNGMNNSTHDDEEPPPLPENGPPLPAKGPPKVNPSMLKFDTRNENKIESLKNLPLILDTNDVVEQTKAVKPISLNLSSTSAQKSLGDSSPITSPLVDMDKTPTGDLLSRGSDSETEPTGTAQILTETELSDWTADDCISENFVDMDFVNSGHYNKVKGGHKKGKRKGADSGSGSGMGRLPSTNEVMKELAKTAPVAEFEGILKSIDLDDIEFMDTGSDSSGTEPHSATNTALLRNRGYVEFVEQTTPKAKQTSYVAASTETHYKPIAMKRDEKLGIDYIEQGAYIMHEDANKTPVNETKQVIGGGAMTTSSIMTQSLTDSSTINDLEDDSTNSQIQISSMSSKPANFSVTTEESEALTVVSSPLDSSPHTRNSSNNKQDYGVGGSTPSSTDRAPKSSQSSTSTGNNSATTSSKATPPRQSSKDSPASIPGIPGDRRSNDELSYEEYVRALQQKIVQISTTARSNDSLEARKHRRKSSKGEGLVIASNPQQPQQQQQTTVIDPITTSNLRHDPKEQHQNNATTIAKSQMQSMTGTTINPSSSAAHQQQQQQQLQKVPEIPTLTSKLEEITKERTKQKDLIHDLVMDKLQSKKQLNVEKRLHRSRQRSILTSGLGGGTGVCGYSSGSSLSPTPKLAAANSTTDANCTNQAHYHVSTAANPTSPSARTAAATQRFLSNSSSFKENTTPSAAASSSSYVSTYGMEALSPTRANAYKQRPFSEHLEGDPLKAFEQRYKIQKTPSFSHVKSAQHNNATTTTTPSSFGGSSSEITTPIPPLRQNRGRHGVEPSSVYSTSTENLRSEARARARLKSNSELGLSPEEKMQLLRKRIQADYNNSNNNSNEKNVDMHPDLSAASYERQTSLRESKMSTSKSVNDLAYLSNSQKQNMNQVASGSSSPKSTLPSVRNDFTSDPNILLSTSEPKSQQSQNIKATTKSGRRVKDPERRKSLIQSLSNFFHMGQGSSKENKHHKDNTTSEGNSARPEHPGTGGISTGGGSGGGSTSGLDGVLSRFRISPKSKDKSRSCIELRDSYIGQKDDYHFHGSGYNSPAGRLRTSSVSMAALSSYENPRHHSSQDALSHSHLSHSAYYSHSQLNSNRHKNNNGNYNPQRINPSSSTSSSQHQHHHHQYHHQTPKQQLYTQQATQQQNRKEVRSTHSSPPTKKSSSSSAIMVNASSSPQLCVHKSKSMTNATSNAATSPAYDDQTPPPIPPLPLNYQRSDDESYTTETRDQKKQRAISKAVRQAELKRLRIAQEIQREQEEIEVQLKELETRGVLIEKALRGEEQTLDNMESTNAVGSNDEKLLKELLEIWRNITQLKKRDEELGIRQQELQLEHRHAQLKEELNLRLSCNKLDKSSADVAAEGAILNEMLEIVAKRAALRPSSSTHDLAATSELLRGGGGGANIVDDMGASGSSSSKIQLSSSSRGQSNDNESNI